MTPGDDVQETSRLQNEVALLEAMYPEEITFSKHAQELKFTPCEGGGLLVIRLPDGYPEIAWPEVIRAHDVEKTDLHNRVNRLIRETWAGEEILDAILNDFQEILCTTGRAATTSHSAQLSVHAVPHIPVPPQHRTTVIWLHHLLNTNKRKLAISPESSEVSGITKPGYPGVLVYSGPKAKVEEHVNQLKSQNWQAFQVRLEDDVAWQFHHGSGVVELESMKDVVKDVGEEHKETFLEAMRMK